MIQGSLRTDINNQSIHIRTAQTESVRIEFLRCRTQATVKWNVVRLELSIVLARSSTGDTRVITGGSSEKCTKPGKVGFWFFPEGTDREGQLAADSAYDCAGIVIKPSFVPATTKQVLTAT